MRSYKGFIIPDVYDSVKYSSLCEELEQCKCTSHHCSTIDCTDCLFSSLNEASREQCIAELRSGRLKMSADGSLTVAGQVPEVLPLIARCADMKKREGNRIGVQVFVPDCSMIDDVVSCILTAHPKLAVHVQTVRKESTCTWDTNPGLSVPQIIVWFPTEKSDTAEHFRKTLIESLSAKFGSVDSKDQIREFLKQISACPAGASFALQFNSMAEVWDEMLSQEQWEYLAYVIGKLMDPKWGADTAVIRNSRNLDSIRQLYEMRNKNPVEYWRTSFSTDFLKNLNPFKIQE